MSKIKIISVLGFYIIVFAGQGQSLQALLDEALTQNPEIRKFEMQHQIEMEKRNEVRSLPNTDWGVGYFVSKPETRTGAQQFKLSVNQMFPWFGTLTSRENYIKTLADTKYEDLVIAKRKLVESVSKMYYDLYVKNAILNIIEKNLQVLKTYETKAYTAMEVGTASMIAVLKLQIRQNDLKQEKEILEYQYHALQWEFNKLLNRKKNLWVTFEDSLFIPQNREEPTWENVSVHPELVRYDKLYASVMQSERLNKKERKPMIGLGVDYINVAPRPKMSFDDNGKDILMPRVSISVPLFNKKYKSLSLQNEMKLQEIHFQKQERVNKLETLLRKAINNRNAAKISYMTQTENLKKMEVAEKILISEYETHSLDFNEILEIKDWQLKLQIKKLNALKDYFQNAVTINYLSQQQNN